MWWHETCGGASMRKLRNVAHREKHAADTPYPLPAQSFHHRIQAVVRQHHGGGGGLTTLQLLLQFRNLPFQRLVMLLETMSLKGIKSEQVCAVCAYGSTASQQREHEGLMCHWEQKQCLSSPVQSAGPGGRWGQRWRCGPGQTGSDPPCWAPWQRQSPTCHSHTCQQPHPWEDTQNQRPDWTLNDPTEDHRTDLSWKLLTERNNLPKTDNLIIVTTCTSFHLTPSSKFNANAN